MINEHDILDFDSLQADAYRDWAAGYGEYVSQTTQGIPSQYAAFMAGAKWVIEHFNIDTAE